MSLWPIDDPTEPEAPLVCAGCHAVGDAPCERGCAYADPEHDVYARDADRHHDEQVSSDADPWEDIF